MIINDSKVRVQFFDKEIDCSYPQSFRGFFEFVEPADQTELLTMLQKEGPRIVHKTNVR